MKENVEWRAKCKTFIEVKLQEQDNCEGGSWGARHLLGWKVGCKTFVRVKCEEQVSCGGDR